MHTSTGTERAKEEQMENMSQVHMLSSDVDQCNRTRPFNVNALEKCEHAKGALNGSDIEPRHASIYAAAHSNHLRDLDVILNAQVLHVAIFQQHHHLLRTNQNGYEDTLHKN